MITCSLRLARISLVALTLGIVVASLSLAQNTPKTADPLPGKNCAQAMSVEAAQPDLDLIGLMTPEPLPKTCYLGSYDEWWKNGEICRTRNTCLPVGQQISGSCPNGYDYRTTEVIICWC